MNLFLIVKGRRVGFMLASALLLLSMTACNPLVHEIEQNGEASANPDAKTSLVYWSSDRHDTEYIKSVIDIYNATNKDNVEVEYVVKAEDYNQALALAYASGQAPDVFRVKENTIQTYYKKGYLAPIDEYLTPEQKATFPIMTDLNEFAGKRYSLPNYGSTMRLVYNVELFKKAGIANPPETLTELVEDAKRIAVVGKADGAYGFALNLKNPDNAIGRSVRVIAEVSGYGGGGYNFKTARYDFGGFKEIIQAFKQMKDDGSILPDMESLDIDSLRAQFAVGKIGMYMTISTEPVVYRDQFPAKVEWAAAPVPTIDGTVRGPSGILGGQWLGLSQDSKHKKEAWAFMNYMYGEGILQQYTEQGFGISMVPAIIAEAKTPDIKGIAGFLPNEYDGVWPIPPIVNIHGEEYFDALSKCIMEQQDVESVLADLTKRYNEALERSQAAGEVNVKPDPDFVPAQLLGVYGK